MTESRFNPRTREECDCCFSCSLFTNNGFNPRTREECDKRVKNSSRPSAFVSIHAPVKSATFAGK